MEATQESETFIAQIKPPRLEDAGLEDCALPPDLIQQAFHKAASAIRSITSNDDESEPRCVDDPWEDTSSDALIGITEGVNAPSGGCSVEKGGGYLEEKDEVVVVGPDLVVVDDDKEEGCVVDGLKGLEIGGGGEKKSEGILGNNNKDDKEEDEEEGEKAILVEGVV